MIIDDRDSGTLRSALGEEWEVVSDQVMGGLSTGALHLDEVKERVCLRLVGDVTTKNNGGFIQMRLPIPKAKRSHLIGYKGIALDVLGNGERYNLHLRTSDLSLPWQSYRWEFEADSKWSRVDLDFSQLDPYRTDVPFRLDRLSSIGLVAIGKNFRADLCMASLRLVGS